MKRPVASLTPTEVDALHDAFVAVLGEARDVIWRRQPPLDEKVRDFLKVRGRAGEPCPRCATTLRSAGVHGHDAEFCPTCGREALTDGTRELTRTVGGRTFRGTVPAQVCPCGEALVTHQALGRFEAAVSRALLRGRAHRAGPRQLRRSTSSPRATPSGSATGCANTRRADASGHSPASFALSRAKLWARSYFFRLARFTSSIAWSVSL